MNQKYSNKKQVDLWYQLVIGASNERAEFLGFTQQTYYFARLTRWRHELQKGVSFRWNKNSFFTRIFRMAVPYFNYYIIDHFVNRYYGIHIINFGIYYIMKYQFLSKKQLFLIWYVFQIHENKNFPRLNVSPNLITWTNIWTKHF